MLCQRCQKKKATVHLTLIMPGGKSDSMQKLDFCTDCFPVSEGDPDAAMMERAFKFLGDKSSADQNPDDVA
jgi:protein-arginine kinase activator protein McsA